MTKETNTAEEYFEENVDWNGTIIMNPVAMIKGYHQEQLDKKIIEIQETENPYPEDVFVAKKYRMAERCYNIGREDAIKTLKSE